MYRLNVQVTTYERQTVPDTGVLRSCDPLKFWGSNYITGIVEPTVVAFCIHVGYINSSNRMTYHPQKWDDYGHVTCFKILLFAVMQHIARVCQRQLSYLFMFSYVFTYLYSNICARSHQRLSYFYLATGNDYLLMAELEIESTLV